MRHEIIASVAPVERYDSQRVKRRKTYLAANEENITIIIIIIYYHHYYYIIIIIILSTLSLKKKQYGWAVHNLTVSTRIKSKVRNILVGVIGNMCVLFFPRITVIIIGCKLKRNTHHDVVAQRRR